METFKNIPISIMLNKSLVGKAPPDWTGEHWKNYYKSFKRTQLTPYVMAGMIWQGYSFTPCYKGGRRLEDNFDAAYHMAFDFDEEGAALDYLMRDGTLSSMLSSFAYSTPSSTPDHPKSRVVFIIPNGINDPQEFRQLYQAIAAEFEREGSKTDPSCKDPLRLYYGSERCDMRVNWSALLPENVEWLLSRYKKENPLPITTPNSTIVTKPADESTIEYLINKEVEAIATAADGSKHHARIKSGYTVGGYVGAGHISQADAEARLIPAARGNSSKPDLAEREIIDSIKSGADKPLPIESKTKKPLSERLK